MLVGRRSVTERLPAATQTGCTCETILHVGPEPGSDALYFVLHYKYKNMNLHIMT